MKKSKLVKRIRTLNPHIYERDIESVIGAVLDEVAEALARGDRVELRGFGAFSVRRRDARIVRNPRTGEQIMAKQKAFIFFKTGRPLRERLNIIDKLE